MDNVLPMLLGACLVSVGVLASALADRIRGLRSSTSVHREPREAPVRRDRASASGTPAQGVTAIAVTSGSDDVIEALVGAGYTKAVAKKSVAACTAQEQASIETWTIAALRRAMGGAS